MKLRVQYTGQLSTAAGRSEEELELTGPTSLAGLLSDLAARLGERAAAHLTMAGGRLPCGLIIVVNGSAVAGPRAAERLLQPGDVVTLLPPIAGG
jgi:molybdopterin converting factor small subunit